MRIRNKQSKKDLESRIEELENKLIQKESELRSSKTTKPGISNKDILLFLSQHEGTEILVYHSESDQFDTVLPIDSYKIFADIPKTLENFVDMFQFDSNEEIEGFFKHSGNENLRFNIKHTIEKGSTKDIRILDFYAEKYKGNNNVYIICIKDITNLSKQKRDLERIKEKIEESDKIKSVILANISHYIRTPLNSVTGFAELLASEDFDSTKRSDYIDIIKRQSKRILTLIDDLSEIAKLESGNINISKIPCSISLMLNELIVGINKYRTDKRKEKVEIKTNLPEEGLELLTDSGRLLQALNHILNYSLRMTNQGSIELGYSLVSDGQKVQFYVQDTSGGISKDEQKNIFNKFSVIENDESTRIDDPGLGLTIARAIVKALGGKIWVESEEGKGTCFAFNIPFEPVENYISKDVVEDEAQPEFKQYNWPNKVILIVDDEEVNAMFIDAVFHGTSVQTIFAKNGQEAIELCKSINKIDLILMDLKMPVLNGIKATQEIRKFNTKVPIIAQTALASEGDMINCKNAGCNDNITKPIEVAKLLYIVNKYISD